MSDDEAGFSYCDTEDVPTEAEEAMRRQYRIERIHRAVTGAVMGLLFALLGAMVADAAQHHDTGGLVRAAFAVILLSVLYYEVVLRRLYLGDWRN